MNLFNVGDKVKVIKYGSMIWAKEDDGEIKVYDLHPEIVGQTGIVSDVNLCQGLYSYALEKIEGKHAWYDEAQLEMVSKNPNYEATSLCS